MKALVFIEQRDGHIKPSAFEALAAAKRVQSDASQIAAVIVGNQISGLNDTLKNYGVSKAYTIDDSSLAQYNVLAYAKAIESAIKAFNPQMVFGLASPMGRDILPRLAARLKAAIVTDVIDLAADGQVLKAKKPLFAGKCIASVSVEVKELCFISVRPNVFPATEEANASLDVEALNLESFDNPLKTIEIRKGDGEQVDLTEAVKIISGGRAMGSADAFKILHECASTIGATVGASRAAVDSGFAPHDMQVGQTGKTVNPNLYIACGISGSVQHMAGMRTSKVIVAINTDPEAPIFKVADYGIVADLFEAVPVLTKKLSELSN